jgi:hypothetical protein
MRITAIEITDYKRVHKVAITPDADRSIILIGGRNGQGKSSTLDALTAAFGGKRAQAADPVRHGAKEAAIFVELDGGKLTIDRTISPNGSSVLEVRDPDGAVKSPQALLDRLIGARFLDPLAFLALPPREQRTQLMRLIKDADRIEDLSAKRARAYDRRTELGRDLTKARGELERLKETAPIGEGTPIDVAALAAEKAKFSEQQRAGDGLGNVVSIAVSDHSLRQARVEQTKETIAELERKLASEREILERDLRDLATAAESEAAARQKLAAAAAAWDATAARRVELDEQIASADATNRAIYEASAHRKRLVEAEAATAKLDADYETCAKAIETIDERKASILAAAQLPVDGLAVTDDGVELNGVPLAQASGAERLRVALALAIHASPGLDDVWIRDGALLDEGSLELVAKAAKAAKKAVWIERVGTSDPGVIVIADGSVQQ